MSVYLRIVELVICRMEKLKTTTVYGGMQKETFQKASTLLRSRRAIFFR